MNNYVVPESYDKIVRLSRKILGPTDHERFRETIRELKSDEIHVPIKLASLCAEYLTHLGEVIIERLKWVKSEDKYERTWSTQINDSLLRIMQLPYDESDRFFVAVETTYLQESFYSFEQAEWAVLKLYMGLSI